MKCKAVLAPRADEFKVTLQARHCSRRFIENFAVLRLALEAQLEAHCYNLRQKAQIEFDKQVRLFNSGASDRRQAPKPPGRQAGQRTAVAKEIRRHGRLMLSPKVVVFGLGRGDLRHVFLIGYANLTQNFKKSGMVKVAEQHRMLDAMRGTVASIAGLAGMLRMLFMLLYDRKRCQRWRLGRAAARLHIKVFSAHLGWRCIPTVVRILPDLLLPRQTGMHSVAGIVVRMSSSRFVEPLPRSKDERRVAERRQRQEDDVAHIWHETIEALDNLARMLRMELLEFGRRMVSWDAVVLETEGVRVREGVL